MLWFLSWVLYGLVVGCIARLFDQKDAPTGFLPTILLGIAGSFMGGFIEYLMGHNKPFGHAGILMGIVGAIICIFAYHKIVGMTGGNSGGSNTSQSNQ